MNEFVKPERVWIADKPYIQKLLHASLVKDLHDDEEVCPHCHGTGLVIRENRYGLSEDPNRSELFPYVHESLSFCPVCYNGVVHRCKLCGEIIPRGRLKHDCDAQREIDRCERDRKEAETLRNAPMATPEILEKNVMFYSDSYGNNNGYFSEWEDFFEDWFDNHESGDPKPEFVWTTDAEEMRIDATNVLESATDDLYEDAICDISDQKRRELQEYLDNFCKTCGVSDTYYQGRYKVRIPWEDWRE